MRNKNTILNKDGTINPKGVDSALGELSEGQGEVFDGVPSWQRVESLDPTKSLPVGPPSDDDEKKDDSGSFLNFGVEGLVVIKFFTFCYVYVDKLKTDLNLTYDFHVGSATGFTPSDENKKSTIFGESVWWFDDNLDEIFVRARARDDGFRYTPYSEEVSSSEYGEEDEDKPGGTWVSDLEFVDGSNERSGWFWTTVMNAGFRWKECPASELTLAPAAGYILRWQEEGWAEWFWKEQTYKLEDLYTDGTWFYGAIPNLIKNATYDIQVRVYDKLGNASEWKPTTPITVEVLDLLDPPTPALIVDLYAETSEAKYRGAEISDWGIPKVFASLGLPEASIVSGAVAKVHYRLKKVFPFFWVTYPTIDVQNLDRVEVGGTWYKILTIPNLQEKTTYQVEFKYEDFTGEQTAWTSVSSLPVFTTFDAEVLSLATTTINHSLVPRSGALLKNMSYDINVYFTVPSGENYYAKRFQIMVAWENALIPGLYSYFSIFNSDEVDDVIGTADTVYTNYSVVRWPSKSFKVGDYSGVKINVRAWMEGKPGVSSYGGDFWDHSTWSDDSKVDFGTVPELTAYPAPVPLVPDLTFFRWAHITPLAADYLMPLNYTDIEIHAVVHGESWDSTNGKSLIWSAPEMALGAKLWVRIPNLVWSSVDGYKKLIWAFEADLVVVVQGVKVVSDVLVRRALASSTAAQAVDTEGDYGVGEGVAAQQVRMVAVYGGDLVFAPNVKITVFFLATGTTGFVIFCQNSISGSGNILNANDIVVLGKEARTLGSGTERFLVTASTAYSVTVTRGYQSTTKETALAGNILIKVGVTNSTYRYSWVDADDDAYKVVKTTDTGSAGSFTTVTQAKFGDPDDDPEWNEGDITIGSNYTLEVGGNLSIESGGDFALKSGGKMSLSAGTITMSGSTINMTSGNFNISSTGSVNISATGGLNMTSGSVNFSGGDFSCSGGTVSLEGAAITLSASYIRITGGEIDCQKLDGFIVTGTGTIKLATNCDLEFNGCCLFEATASDMKLLPDTNGTDLYLGNNGSNWEFIGMWTSENIECRAAGDIKLYAQEDLYLCSGVGANENIFVKLPWPNVDSDAHYIYKLHATGLSPVLTLTLVSGPE